MFGMQAGTVAVIFGVLIMEVWAQVALPTVSLAACDSAEAEALALVAQDFLNTQHTHGYKYALNRIEKVKILSTPGQDETYLLELDLLETTCHVLDPTPVSLCPVRQKLFTAVEADCDFALSNTTQGLSVVAFKCKTETESAEDLCLGCPLLIPLNDTAGLQLIQTSLDDFNKNHSLNTKFALFEIGRISSQVVSNGNQYFAEYAIIGTNCTSHDEDTCVPQNHTVAIHGFCWAEGSALENRADCKIFNVTEVVEPTTNTTVRVQKRLHAHSSGPDHNPNIHGLTFHKLTALHDPAVSGLLSAESAESAELLTLATQNEITLVKREVPATLAAVQDTKPIHPGPVLLAPLCPGKKKHF